MLALTSPSGRLSSAVVSAILKHKLYPVSKLVLCTSSDPNNGSWDLLKDQGIAVRHSNYDSQSSMQDAFAGCSKLLLVSSPRTAMDFHNPPHGSGREVHHFAAIRAAMQAGVQHIFYTSLAFKPSSKAAVMTSHLRTEEFLAGVRGEGVKVTIIRQGLESESWPLYFGFFDPKSDKRWEVVVAGDGKISWTAVKDLGLGTAMVVVEPSDKYDDKTFYLSAPHGKTLRDVAMVVSEVKGKKVCLKIVDREEYCRYYIEEKGMDPGEVDWLSSTYESLRNGDCDIEDWTLSELLAERGLKLKPLEETIKEMSRGD
jgi:uncharacterized protein YbjT (DUF2867 family)